MLFLYKQQLENGAWDNLDIEGSTKLQGYYTVHPDCIIPDSFPFVDIELKIINGMQYVVRMTSREIIDDTEPKDKREQCYMTGTYDNEHYYYVNYDGEQMTVDEANKLWQEYSAEGRDMSTLSAQIQATKNQVRETYVDEEI